MKKTNEPIMINGFEIVFEKRKMPKDKGTIRHKQTSIWDRIIKVIKPGDSFVIPHNPSHYSSLVARAKKKRFKLGSRSELHGPHKRLRIYRLK